MSHCMDQKQEKPMSDEFKNLLADHEALAAAHIELAELCEKMAKQIQTCLTEVYNLKVGKNPEIE